MFLCTVPMFHIYGLVAFATGLLTSGSTIVVLSKFEMHDMLLSIQRNHVSYLPLMALINVADQGPAEQGSDRGVLGEVSDGDNSSRLRIDEIDRSWSVNGFTGGESQVRYDGAVFDEHGSYDCGSGQRSSTSDE
ncbi:hypothetical protein TB1_024136 [Malus domestica]